MGNIIQKISGWWSPKSDPSDKNTPAANYSGRRFAQKNQNGREKIELSPHSPGNPPTSISKEKKIEHLSATDERSGAHKIGTLVQKFFQSLANKLISPFTNWRKDRASQKLKNQLLKLTPIESHAADVQELSYQMGALLLTPMNQPTDLPKIQKFVADNVEKGRTQTRALENCGKDLFRFTPQITLRGKDGRMMTTPEHLKELSGSEKNQQTGRQMRDLLNRFYREISGEDQEIISSSPTTQEDAAQLIKGLPSLLDSKQIKGKHRQQLEKFVAFMGLQVIPTRIPDWAIPGGSTPDGSPSSPPLNFRKGHKGLLISELSNAYRQTFQDFKYERTQEFSILSDGRFQFELYSPITFKADLYIEQKPIGTCGLRSTLIFNDEMELTSFSQEVVPAPQIWTNIDLER